MRYQQMQHKATSQSSLLDAMSRAHQWLAGCWARKAALVGVLLAVSLLLATPAWAAPILAWDAVTTDATGAVLGPGLEVSAYKVYKCGTALSGPCVAPERVLMSTVSAPATQVDLAGQVFPQVYVVTAVNKAGESLDSVKFKVTPGDAPKNPRLP